MPVVLSQSASWRLQMLHFLRQTQHILTSEKNKRVTICDNIHVLITFLSAVCEPFVMWRESWGCQRLARLSEHVDDMLKLFNAAGLWTDFVQMMWLDARSANGAQQQLT